MFHDQDTIAIYWERFLAGAKHLENRFSISWGDGDRETVYQWQDGDPAYALLPSAISLGLAGEFTLTFSGDRPPLALIYDPDFDDAIFHLNPDLESEWAQQGNRFIASTGDQISFRKAYDGIQIVGTVDLGGGGDSSGL